MFIKQSTSYTHRIGPFVDDADGYTEETGLSIANTDVRLSKNGGAFAAKNSGGGTHDEKGWYYITLNTTDTNTVGILEVYCNVAGALPVFKTFYVLDTLTYEGLFTSTPDAFTAAGLMAADVEAISADTTAANNLESCFDGTGYTVDANLVEMGGATQSATDLKDFADAGYDPSNNVVFSDLQRIDGSSANATDLSAIVDEWSSGGISADIVKIKTDSQSATDLKDFVDNGFDTVNNRVYADVQYMETGVITADALSAGAVQEIFDALDGIVSVTGVDDIYHARIDFNLDENNTQDEYNVMWYKNGIRVDSGITSPTIQVIKRSDGTDLVASTSMSEVASTHYFKYDEATNRITIGEGYVVLAGATIDGEARSFARFISRDVTA